MLSIQFPYWLLIVNYEIVIDLSLLLGPVGKFLRVLRFAPSIKLISTIQIEILLIMVLNIIALA